MTWLWMAWQFELIFKYKFEKLHHQRSLRMENKNNIVLIRNKKIFLKKDYLLLHITTI